MKRLTKIIENIFIDIYLGKTKVDSANNFQQEIRKRWLEKYSMEELMELLSNHPGPKRLDNLVDDLSKKESIDFLKQTYIPFLRSIKVQIGKERIEKHEFELEEIKKELAICLKANKENQIQNLKDGMKHVEGTEAEKKQRLEKELQEISDRFKYVQLIPTVSIFQKKNIHFYEKVIELANHFEDIYDEHREQLFEYEMQLLKISLEKIAQLTLSGVLDISIPQRDEQVKKIDDILAILLL